MDTRANQPAAEEAIATGQIRRLQHLQSAEPGDDRPAVESTVVDQPQVVRGAFGRLR